MRSGRRRWLLLAIAMLGVLAIIYVPKYRKALQTSREAVLRNNLRDMRDAIDQFTDDKQRAPESLQDLVAAGYFRQLLPIR